LGSRAAGYVTWLFYSPQMLARVSLLAVLAAARRAHEEPSHAEQEFIDAGDKLKQFEQTDLRDLYSDATRQNNIRGSPESLLQQGARPRRPGIRPFRHEHIDPQIAKFEHEQRLEDNKWKKMEHGFHIMEQNLKRKWNSPELRDEAGPSSFLQDGETSVNPLSPTFKDSMETQLAEQKEKLASFIENAKKKFHAEVDANKKKTDDMLAAMKKREDEQEKAIAEKLKKAAAPASLIESVGAPSHAAFEEADKERMRDQEDLQMIRAKLEAQEARMDAAQKALKDDDHNGGDDLGKAVLHLSNKLTPPTLKEMGMA